MCKNRNWFFFLYLNIITNVVKPNGTFNSSNPMTHLAIKVCHDFDWNSFRSRFTWIRRSNSPQCHFFFNIKINFLRLSVPALQCISESKNTMRIFTYSNTFARVILTFRKKIYNAYSYYYYYPIVIVSYIIIRVTCLLLLHVIIVMWIDEDEISLSFKFDSLLVALHNNIVYTRNIIMLYNIVK